MSKRDLDAVLHKVMIQVAEDALERRGPSLAAEREAREVRPTVTDRWGTVTNPYDGVVPDALTSGPDTVEITVWGMLAEEVCQHVAMWFLGATPFDEDFEGYFEPRGHGARRYRRLLVAPGVKVYAESVTGHDHIHIEIEGQGMRGISQDHFRVFLVGLNDKARRMTSTRFDFAWNNVPFDPVTVYLAAKRGDIRCTSRRSKNWARFMDGDAGEETDWEDEDFDEPCGSTCYIGKRGAERMLRVYNGRGYNRCELETRGDRATALMLALMDAPVEQWSRVALGHLLDFITFCDRKADSNISRAALVLLPWWAEFLGGAERAMCRIRRKVRISVDAAKRKAEKLARGVAQLHQVFGPRWFAEKLAEAAAKYADVDRPRVRALRAALFDAQAEVGAVIARSIHPSWLADVAPMRR